MATIERYELKAGRRWRVRYRTPDHRQTDKRGFKTRRDAEAFAATVETEKLTGSYIAPTAGRVKVSQIAKTWREGLSHLKPKTRENSLSSYYKHVRPVWGDLPVSEVRMPAVRSWVARMHESGAKPATIERALGVLRQIMAVAVESGNLAVNPVQGVRAPRREHRPRGYLTHAQVDELAAAAGDDGPLVLFLAYTGLRFGEAAALRLRDVDMLRRRITVERSVVEVGGKMTFGTPKTHGRRTVPIPEFLALAIAPKMEGKTRDQLVFGSGDEPLRLNNWRRRGYGRALDACRGASSTFPKVSVHDLRHTAASLAISAGANVKAVQTMMGHASAAMTLDVYADLFPDDLEAVAAALDTAHAALSS